MEAAIVFILSVFTCDSSYRWLLHEITCFATVGLLWAGPAGYELCRRVRVTIGAAREGCCL
jgi:hypothetical protein